MHSLLIYFYFTTSLIVQVIAVNFNYSTSLPTKYIKKWTTPGLRCSQDPNFVPISESSDCTHAIALIPSQRPTKSDNEPSFSFRMPAAFRAGNCIVGISALGDPGYHYTRDQFRSNKAQNLPLWASAKTLAEAMVYECVDGRNQMTRYNYAIADSQGVVRDEGYTNEYTRIPFRVAVFGLPSNVVMGPMGRRRKEGWVDNVTTDLGYNLYQAVGIAPPGGMANWDSIRHYARSRSNGDVYPATREARVEGYDILYIPRTYLPMERMARVRESTRGAGG